MAEAKRALILDVIVSTYPLYQAPLGSVFALKGKLIPLITVVTDLASVHRLWFSEDSDFTVTRSCNSCSRVCIGTCRRTSMARCGTLPP